MALAYVPATVSLMLWVQPAAELALMFCVWRVTTPRRCERRRRARLHNAGEEQHQLEDQDEHDRELQELSTRDRDLLDRKTIDVVQCLQLVFDAGLPHADTEARRHELKHPGGVDVPDHLQRVLR